MKKIIALVLSAILLMACFAGCASTGSTGGQEEKKTIVVGYTIYAPMNYFDDNNTLVGFDTDLAKAVFENLGYTVLFQEIDWAQKYTDLTPAPLTACGTASPATALTTMASSAPKRLTSPTTTWRTVRLSL